MENDVIIFQALWNVEVELEVIFQVVLNDTVYLVTCGILSSPPLPRTWDMVSGRESLLVGSLHLSVVDFILSNSYKWLCFWQL